MIIRLPVCVCECMQLMLQQIAISCNANIKFTVLPAHGPLGILPICHSSIGQHPPYRLLRSLHTQTNMQVISLAENTSCYNINNRSFRAKQSCSIHSTPCNHIQWTRGRKTQAMDKYIKEALKWVHLPLSLASIHRLLSDGEESGWPAQIAED